MAKQSAHTANVAIEAVIRAKDSRNEAYTPDELAYIRHYTGAGGKGSDGATGAGLLHEFYTPDYVAGLMWELAVHYGFPKNGNVLEPSCGTGVLLDNAPDFKNCTGFEINETSARIAELTHPGATIHRGYFETAFLTLPLFRKRMAGATGETWLRQYPFDLVIGNPPYGIYKNQYSSYFNKKLFAQIEIFFILQGVALLKKGGLLIYLQSSNFMRNGDKYTLAKVEIGKEADLIDAYRLPTVFASSDVPTDIMILRKK